MEMNDEIRKMTDIIDYQLGDLAGDAEDAAKALYGLGYRQINEVRKETAKEIYKMLLGTEHIKVLEQKKHCDWWVSRWRIEDLNRVFKEFGVEVEGYSDIHELESAHGTINKEKTYCKYADWGMEGCECQAHHGNDWGYCEYKSEQHRCPYYEPAKEVEE